MRAYTGSFPTIDKIDYIDLDRLGDYVKHFDYQTIIFMGAFANKEVYNKLEDLARKTFPRNYNVLIPIRRKYDLDLESKVALNLLNNTNLENFVSISLSSLSILKVLQDVPKPLTGVFLSPWVGYSSLSQLNKSKVDIYSYLHDLKLKKKYRGIPIDDLKNYLLDDGFERLNPGMRELIKNGISHHNLTAILQEIDPIIDSTYSTANVGYWHKSYYAAHNRPCGLYIRYK